MSSDSSSSLVAAQQAEIAQLRAREASLTRIAVQSVASLRALDEDGRPAGMWLSERDSELLRSLQNRSLPLEAGDRWQWTNATKMNPISQTVLDYLTQSIHTSPRPALVPFRSAFPLEVLEHIVTLADTSTIDAFARASFSCLQIFGPRLLAYVTNRKNPKGLASLFAGRVAPSSARLVTPLSLHHLQVLDITATALSHGAEISDARLTEPVHLAKLIIRIDFEPVEFVDRPEDETDPSVPLTTHPLNTVRPSVVALALLDPMELLLRGPWLPNCEDRQYRITRAASALIANWTRLQTIRLVNVDLFVLPASYLDDADYLEDELPTDIYDFFLSPKVQKAVQKGWQAKGLQQWTLIWDFGGRYGEPHAFGLTEGRNLPRQLAGRDKTLQMQRIKDAIIVVKDETDRLQLEKQIENLDVQERGPLKVLRGGEDEEYCNRDLDWLD